MPLKVPESGYKNIGSQNKNPI